jgi:hypothetical protein
MHFSTSYTGLALAVGLVSAIPVLGEWIERGVDKATYAPTYFYSYNNPRRDVAIEARGEDKATYAPAYFYSYNNPKRGAAIEVRGEDLCSSLFLFVQQPEAWRRH